MKKIEFVYFDLGNVIVNFDHEIGCQKMAAVAGCTADLVRQVIFDSDVQNAFETGTVDGPAFFENFCEQTDTRPDYDDLYRASGDIFHLNAPILSIIAQLSFCRMPLGILSNTCVSHWDHCVRHYRIVHELFSTHILSYESQSMKPDRKIYEDAIAAAGCAADAIFFTDDRPENVAGAIDAGIDAVLYTSAAALSEELRQRYLIL
jgi:FMN phosphatase YigB (HAD superfamily)